MRRSLGGGWSIELVGHWQRERIEHGVTSWRAPGRTLRVAPGGPWRCASAVDIIASLDAELPPDPAGKVGEGGRNGVGHRAAWFYRHGGGTSCALYGYTFVDGAYLETVFVGRDATDLAWAFDAWRSVSLLHGGSSDSAGISG
ncbi:hypothetical protein ACVCAH_28500 [Micromonospora sp. LZ34]